MDTQKIKKSANTLTGLVVTMLIVIGAFAGMFLFFNQKISENNLTMESNYNNTYSKLLATQGTIENDSIRIQDNLKNVSEATSAYSVAINGMKGVGNVMLIVLHFVQSASDTVNALVEGIQDILPTWAKASILIGVLLAVVILIFAIFKGDQGKT